MRHSSIAYLEQGLGRVRFFVAYSASSKLLVQGLVHRELQPFLFHIMLVEESSYIFVLSTQKDKLPRACTESRGLKRRRRIIPLGIVPRRRP